MTKFDYETHISETKIAAYKARAVAESFAREYISSTDYHVTAALIETNPDNFVYLYTVIEDALCEVCRMLDKLEEMKVEA